LTKRPDRHTGHVPPDGAQPAPWPTSRLVLLVEDEEPVRNYAAELLSALGLSVVSTVDGPDALGLYGQLRGELALVLLDLGLPGIDGAVVLAEINRDDAHVPTIVCSGSDPSELTRELAGQQVAGILQKPYGLRDLREVVEKALGTDSRA
jgi:two-component system cell cycle sensor histidine kinase/response regulator CckA